MNKFSLYFICGGTVALALSLVMGWIGIPYILQAQIKKSARLIKNRDTYNAWKNPPRVPVYKKFYVFNLTNGDEVQNGGKPIVIQVGPYTYLEKQTKVDNGPGERNHTFEYRNKRLLYFLPEMSTGSEQDLVTIINIPFLTLAAITADLEDSSTIQKMMNDKLTETGESLFITAPVRTILFDGISVQRHFDLLQENESNDTKIPDAILDGKYSIYEGKNGTENILYEVNNGLGNYKDFGRIEARDNETLLSWWKNESCNTMNGTDGTMFAPFLTHSTILRTYSPEMCRTHNLIFEKELNYKGTPGFRFKQDPKLHQGTHNNPENWCFCMEEDEKSCERNGILLVEACNGGIPLSISSPHFYGADASLVEAVDGLEPDEEKHATFVDIEPETAVVMNVVKRIQTNVELKPNANMAIISNVRSVTLPVVWVEELMALNENELKFFGQLKTFRGLVDQGRWILLGGSSICVALGALVGMVRRDKTDTMQLMK